MDFGTDDSFVTFVETKMLRLNDKMNKNGQHFGSRYR